MSRRDLWFVDATILSALITPEPSSDQVLRWFRHGQTSWITSEISVALCLSRLQQRGLALHRQQAALEGLLQLLRLGVGIRPLPLEALARQPWRPLPPIQALQLHTALHWRCSTLASHESALVQAAQEHGLNAISLGPPTAAAPGRWETGRRRSPIQP